MLSVNQPAWWYGTFQKGLPTNFDTAIFQGANALIQNNWKHQMHSLIPEGYSAQCGCPYLHMQMQSHQALQSQTRAKRIRTDSDDLA